VVDPSAALGSARRPLATSAAGSAFLRELISGPDSSAERLGSFRTAIYLRLARGDVIGVLSRDAVRLPLGLVLPTSSLDFPLNRLVGPIRVGSGRVQIGDWRFHVSRVVSVQAPVSLVPRTDSHALVCKELRRTRVIGSHPALLPFLRADPGSARLMPEIVDRLLGAGPGLTPSGDDFLAGLLVAARAFGLPIADLCARVLAAAPGGTTDLSAALLRCACRGEAIPQVSALLSAMSQESERVTRLHDALRGLCAVGHTSGEAMAIGVAAATTAARMRTQEPAALQARAALA
jgi:hypothetical protein